MGYSLFNKILRYIPDRQKYYEDAEDQLDIFLGDELLAPGSKIYTDETADAE
jgi:hypothetical protein